MANILGLDLGTNSIGWALVQSDFENKTGQIINAGSRIIPMTQDVLGKFDSGQSVSQTAERTGFRGIRRLRERNLLRRERLHRVLNVLHFLPAHYANQIDFEKKLGQFKKDKEPKIAYSIDAQGKNEFFYKNAFNEMILEFKNIQPDLFYQKEDGVETKVPYDWTIYYLRKKALSQKVEKEELAWLLLNFNQKRGYYQLRGEEEETVENKLVEFHSLKVVNVIADEKQKGKDETWYNLVLENGWTYRRSSKIPLYDWQNKVKEFVVTTELNDDGSIKKDKDGKEKRSFRAPQETDWTLIKTKTEQTINNNGKTVGTYIYESLLSNPKQKIRGKLVRTIERKFYKNELIAILKEQSKYHPEFSDRNILKSCINELYEYNEIHQSQLLKKDLSNLLIEDILFYQRPLKSKKSEIENCKFEFRKYKRDGIEIIESLKCVPKSHPLYQEFRLWQWIDNLRIYQKEKVVGAKIETDVDVSNEFLAEIEKQLELFDWLSKKEEISQEELLKQLFKYKNLKPAALKDEIAKYRWNYVPDKIYPCCTTRHSFLTRLGKIDGYNLELYDSDFEIALWHLMYSVSDKEVLKKALHTFAQKNHLPSQFEELFAKYPPYKSEYGAYSLKAINKLLPLMRKGKYWNVEKIHPQTVNRIDKILNAEYDERIKTRVREKAIQLQRIEDFKGLPLWLASYIVYDRHSEDENAQQWKNPNEIQFLEQHELRNPIVEKVINETLRVVKDIWLTHGKGQENFFKEVHVELGREMKNNAADRKKITEQVTNNENTNLRLKALLVELKNDKDYENVIPHSPFQQEKLKIFEDGILNGVENVPEDILKISKMAQPTNSELLRYKLWLEQGYVSPYTGAIIPLNKLFTTAYQIEHIIPQSRFFDDSFTNKVICESEINQLKDNQLAYEFIIAKGGSIIELNAGNKVHIFNKDQYLAHIDKYFSKSKSKKKKLLLEDIPEEFVARQLNDTRYISKEIKRRLSNIVREKDELESTSKNLITTNGEITSKLKQDWGLNDVWNTIIYPRFERLNSLTSSANFGNWTTKDGKKVFQTSIPLEFQKGFSKKRIDHRHHALDAIVIALTSRNHVNYYNNQHALGKKSKDEKQNNRVDLRTMLCNKTHPDENGNYKWLAKKPWDNFTQNALDALEHIVVSFKQNNRIINKSVNYYQKIVENAHGELKKEFVKQTEGENWAIRKPLHKDTVSGLVTLKFKKQVTLSVALDNWEMIVDKGLKSKVKALLEEHYDKKKLIHFFKSIENKWGDKDISKVDIYYWDSENVASRVALNESFNYSKIESITDVGIQKILINHLSKYDESKSGKVIEHPELAFSPEGIEEMNKSIVQLNDGIFHQPILKVRTFEPKGNKFQVGTRGNKKDKYVEAAKGTNLFFAIYKNEEGKRNYETIPLNIVIERLKQGLAPVPEKNENDDMLLFYLSPDDLVYVPTEDEHQHINKLDFKKLTKEQKQRIYKMVSATGGQCMFIRHDIATPVINKFEFSPLNKMEKSIDGIMIKDHCFKLRISRLGAVSLA